MKAYVPPNWTGRLLVWAEAPGADEDKAGRPMVGRAGKLLYELLRSVGFSDSDIAITNSVRCRPVGNATPDTRTSVKLCRPFSTHDVCSLQPKWLLAVGGVAAKSVTGLGTANLGKMRQRVFDASDFFGESAKGIRTAFTFHPEACLYPGGKEVRAKMESDLQWLVNFRGYREGPVNEEPEIHGAFCEDIEWDKNHKLITVSKAWGNRSVVTENAAIWADWLEAITTSKPTPFVIGHSIFGDLAVLRANGTRLPLPWITGEKVRDTITLARLKDENSGSYNLESLSVSRCGVRPWKSASDSLISTKKTAKAARDFSTIPSDIRMERCRTDSWASGLVAKDSLSGLNGNVVSFLHRLGSLLKRVEMAGVKIDQPRYDQIKTNLSGLMKQREEALLVVANKYGMAEFEASNANHFRELLYEKIGAEPQKYTAKSDDPAVGKDALVLSYQLGSEAEKEAILARLRYEKAHKLYTTYIGEKNEDEEKGLAKHLTGNFFVFQRINPLGARTGRRSSTAPNMQNWPKRMRKLAVSRFKNGEIVKGDFSQLEPRIMAVVAGIDDWLDCFLRGENFYLYVAKRMWGKEVEKDTELYKVTKSTVLGTNYGMEVDLFIEKMSIEQGLHLSREEGSDILKRYHGTWPPLPRYFNLQRERILHQGWVDNMVGQRRHLPCPEGERTRGFKHKWNQAANHPIQSTAAYITGSSELDLETALLDYLGLSLEEHYDNLVRFWGLEKLSLDNTPLKDVILSMGREIDYPVLVNEVHDEIVVDSPKQHADAVFEIMQEVMKECPTLRTLWPQTRALSLLAEVTRGTSWGGS